MEKKQQETADKKILKQEIAVYSEKYNVQGKVMDYGVVTKLVFNYDGKDIEIGIQTMYRLDARFWNPILRI